MNAGMKDMLNVMSKFLAMGMPLDDVIARVDVEPGARDQARGTRPPDGGRAAPMSRCCGWSSGEFGFVDMYGARIDGKRRLACEMTFIDGRVVYDLNGRSREEWEKLPKDYGRLRAQVRRAAVPSILAASTQLR